MKKAAYIQQIVFALTLIFSGFAGEFASAQGNPVNPAEPPPIEQQLENLTESSNDEVTEDDSYIQELIHFAKEPLNLNYVGEGQLQELNLLSPMQIDNFLTYRNLLGNFINIYELQAIPGWDVELIKKMRPYVTVINKYDVINNFRSRFKKGESTILARSIQVLEKSKGYLYNNNSTANFYEGSPQKLLVRYKYIFKNLLQYGVTAEKDAGEQFFKRSQKAGFDFYSAHLFARNLGIIKSLAIGDFTVNLGQGLIQWQSLGFKKSSEVLNIKRQAEILRPYNSANEIVFNRGVGITIKKNNWETTGFVSFRKLDANFNSDSINPEGYVSSLQSSGYHRTSGELADRHIQSQVSFGGNISYATTAGNVGLNAVHYNFGYPLLKASNLYNLYSLSGTSFGNYSVDYSYTFHNMHFFGEAAVDEKFDKAFINGLLINMDSRVSMSFLYRRISPGYQSLYSNAFTENTFPTNEAGLYSGINITPSDILKINAYADFYHFPWLKFRVDAPSSGVDYMVQLMYTPNKQVEMYVRYRNEKKPINDNPGNLPLNPTIEKQKQGIRTQVSCKINSRFTLRSRVDLSWFDHNQADAQSGFLFYTDVIYKPMARSFSGNVRLQYFDTDGYDSRLYAYEDDVLYGYSIPVFYEKGYRYYINAHYKLGKSFSIWARFAQTIYPDKKTIGSGLDLINKNKKSEITLQVIREF